MTKNEYFFKALKAGNYKIMDWVISLFCLSKDADNDNLYPFKLSLNPSGHFYRNEAGEQVRIEDADPAQPLFRIKDRVDITPELVENCVEALNTTYGNVILNHLLLIYCFGSKIPFMTGKISVGKIEALIIKNFRDDPLEGEERDPKAFYVSEYLKFADAAFSLTSLTQTCVWASTEKNILPPDGLAEFKKSLLAKYGDKIEDPVVIAQIEKELIAFDAEWRKGDPGNAFFISAKSVKVARKKKFLIQGGIVGTDGNSNKMSLVRNSLYEGMEVETFPEMASAQRLASYSRGAETMMGGVEVKWMLRASSNLTVAGDDCGSKLGMTTLVSPSNIQDIVGFYLVSQAGPVFIENEEQAGTYLGKKVMRRSPMFCKLEKTDYCKVCVGKRLSDTPFALSSAVSAYGNSFLALFLAKAHGSALETEDLDIAEAFF